MDAVVIGLVSSACGFIFGHFHARVSNSTCLYGLCSVSGLNIDVDKKENSEKPQENNNI